MKKLNIVDSEKKLNEAILDSKEGFWIAIGTCEALDTTYESHFEYARFYPGKINQSIRESLASLDRLMEGREVMFTSLILSALDQAIEEVAPEAIHLKEKSKWRLEKNKEGVFSGWEDFGLSFIHQEQDGNKHWGTLFILFDANDCVERPRLEKPTKAFWDLESYKKEKALSIAKSAAEKALNLIESEWNLGSAIQVHRREDLRIHWGDNSNNSCQSEDSDKKSLSMLEAFYIEKECKAGIKKSLKSL